MKTIIITSLITIMTATLTLGNINDQNENNRRSSMAEEDFQECAKLYLNCLQDTNDKCYNPEIMIVKEDGSCLASGEMKNAVVQELLKVSDFLTEVHGTRYYRMIKIGDLTNNQSFTVK